MKNKILMVMFLLSTQSFLVNCAKKDSTPAAAAVGVAQQCGVGAVYTQQGCLPISTGQCQAGYGYSPQFGCVPPSYNNGGVGQTGQTCQAGSVGTVVGCLPQGQCQVGMGYYAQTTYQGQQSPTGFCFYRSY